MKIKHLSIFILFFFIVVACSKQSDAINSPTKAPETNIKKIEQITFAMEASYPPFESMDEYNKIVGLDVDLAKALCKKIEAKCNFKHQLFDSLIPDLMANKIDAIISAMDITKERQQQVAFTKPYINNSAIFISKNNQSNLVDLKGKKIGVQEGTTQQKYLEDKYGQSIKIVLYNSYQTAFSDLYNEDLQYVFGDSTVANSFLNTETELMQVGEPIIDNKYFGIGMGIAVNQSNTTLLSKFNDALVAIKENGQYNEIYAKWIN